MLPLFRLGTAEVKRLVAGAARNTDDNARVEFSAPKAMYEDTTDPTLAYIEKFAVSRSSTSPRLPRAGKAWTG